ncbi:MAG TPA: hypothetical protein VFB20_13810 [Burkholderiales bacterium]|nr:hypothetical protein [Burkholderiales bacterium]
MSAGDRLLHAAHVVARMRLKLVMALAHGTWPGRSPVAAMGLSFPSCIGMAAGLDRYGSMAHLAHRIGIGFVETGTVTTLPEPEHNRGIGVLLRSLEHYGWMDAGARTGRARLGISIGRNSWTPPEKAWRDFAECLARGWQVADYFTLNLGSLVPALAADRGLLVSFLARIKDRRHALASERNRRVPILVKLQLREDTRLETARLAECIAAFGFDGILAATGDNGAGKAGPAGLLQHLGAVVEKKTAIVSVGGIRSPADAIERLRAGATMIQIHRALLRPGSEIARALGAATFPHSLGSMPALPS